MQNRKILFTFEAQVAVEIKQVWVSVEPNGFDAFVLQIFDSVLYKKASCAFVRDMFSLTIKLPNQPTLPKLMHVAMPIGS